MKLAYFGADCPRTRNGPARDPVSSQSLRSPRSWSTVSSVYEDLLEFFGSRPGGFSKPREPTWAPRVLVVRGVPPYEDLNPTSVDFRRRVARALQLLAERFPPRREVGWCESQANALTRWPARYVTNGYVANRKDSQICALCHPRPPPVASSPQPGMRPGKHPHSGRKLLLQMLIPIPSSQDHSKSRPLVFAMATQCARAVWSDKDERPTNHAAPCDRAGRVLGRSPTAPVLSSHGP